MLDWHDLKIDGCPAFLRALKTIEDTLQQQQDAITELHLLSEEIMTGRPGRMERRRCRRTAADGI